MRDGSPIEISNFRTTFSAGDSCFLMIQEPYMLF